MGAAMSLRERLRGKRTEPSPLVPDVGPPRQSGPSLSSRTSQVELRLRGAGPTTLHGCDRILAVVVMHERPVGMVEPGDSPGAAVFGLTPQRIAHGFVEDYKRPGWVPGEVKVDGRTAITVLQRPETGQLTAGEANALLAAMIAASVPEADIATCAAISFSGRATCSGTPGSRSWRRRPFVARRRLQEARLARSWERPSHPAPR